MSKLRNAADETAFHLGESVAHVTLLFVEGQELAFYGIVKLTQIAAANTALANRDENLPLPP